MYKKLTNKRRSTIELFAGAGGLALGMELAGCDCRAMFEFNACACETLRANWNGVKFSNCKPLIFDGDVRQTDYSRLPTRVGREIDGVVAGPPC